MRANQATNDEIDTQKRVSECSSFAVDLEAGNNGIPSRRRRDGTPGGSIDITMSIQLHEFCHGGPNPFDVYFNNPREINSRLAEDPFADDAESSESSETAHASDANRGSMSLPSPYQMAHINLHYTPRNSYQCGQQLPAISEVTAVTPNGMPIRVTTGHECVTSAQDDLPMGLHTIVIGGAGQNTPIKKTWQDRKHIVWIVFGLVVIAGIAIPLSLFVGDFKIHILTA